MTTSLFPESSWTKFKYDSELAAWCQDALPHAIESTQSAQNNHWFRHQRTWFVGVNVLPNDSQGRIASGTRLSGSAINSLQQYVDHAFTSSVSTSTTIEWDRAQISVCYPGYPLQDQEESESAHLFRIQRDAAHVDGLLKEGSSKARFVREHHAFILGIPLSQYSQDAAPFVVWEGSDKIIQQRLHERLATIPIQSWPTEDISQAYIEARKEVFDVCERKEICAGVGEAFAVHRLAVHGMAPWRSGASCDSNGRIIAYFRPQIIDADQWLHAP